ncbi:MAG: hypothetical protein ACI8VT_002390, partial [Saprospiraceae bacterium]
ENNKNPKESWVYLPKYSKEIMTLLGNPLLHDW